LIQNINLRCNVIQDFRKKYLNHLGRRGYQVDPLRIMNHFEPGMWSYGKPYWSAILLFLTLTLVIGCSSGQQTNEPVTQAAATGAESAVLALTALQPVELGGEKLSVLVTTGIIGDVVGQVGGEAIDLRILMEAGQDPHSFEPSAGDLVAAAEADVIFINGWDLEEGLVDDLENIAGDVSLVPISAGITPIPFGQVTHASDGTDDQHQASSLQGWDPHTWLDPHLVRQWLENGQQVLAALDPANADSYAANAADYLAGLDRLIAYYDERFAQIPPEKRKMVTNHDALGYLAEAYEIDIVGTVIPVASTVAEPSAADLARLLGVMEREGVCTIFAESTANEALAETVAAELGDCPGVQILTLYTGALGPPGSGADNYLAMMRVNMETIAAGLSDSSPE
jgi:ABC-type Zn uptake system ZnuABC Zn-binding protein ZnuA